MPTHSGWDNINKLMYPPLNIDSGGDIQQALASGYRDIGGAIRNGTINKWAMFKPQRSANLGFINYNNNERADGFYGFVSLPYATTVQQLLNLYAGLSADGNTDHTSDTPDAWDNGWQYKRPRGVGSGYTEYFRFSDFVKVVSGAMQEDVPGYYAKARNPFGRFDAVPTSVSMYYGHLIIQNDWAKPIDGSSWPEYNLAIADFNALQGSTTKLLYYGALLVPPNTSAAYKIVGNDTDTIGTTRGAEDLTYELELTPSAYAVGAWTVYPCLSNIAFPATFLNVAYANRTSALPDSRRLYPIPGATPIVITIYEDNIVITARARAEIIGGYVDWSFEIKNNSNDSITLTEDSTGIVKFRFEGNDWSTAIQNGEVVLSSTGTQLPSSITIAAGQTYSFPGSGLSTSTAISNNNVCKMIVGYKLNGALKTGEATFIMPVDPDLAPAL